MANLARWQRTIVDEAGNVMPGASVTVRREVAGFPLAVLYTDRLGATPAGNPVTADEHGFAYFHVTGGAYRITATLGSLSIEWRYVAIGTNAETDQGNLTDPGYLLRYEDETSAPPSEGCFRANNADLSAATEIYVSKTTGGGFDFEDRLLELAPDGKTVKNTVLFNNVAAGGCSFLVDAVADHTGYVTLAVSGHAGSTAFTDGDDFGLQREMSGNDGVSSGLILVYDSTTTDSDPGAGKFRLNNATVASATAAYFDNVEALAGASITALLDSWDDSNAAIKGQIKFIDLADAAVFRIFNVTGSVVDGTGYRKLTIASVTGAGSFTNGHSFAVDFNAASNDGVAGIKYNFSTTTTDSDPGAGTLRLNHATPASATAAYVDNVDADGATATSWLDTFDDGNGTIKGTLTLRSLSTPSVFAQYSVTGAVVDGTGYRKLTLAYLAGNGSFTSGMSVTLGFSRAGNDGFTPGVRLTFSTTTSDADPGAGVVRFNNGTFASITQIYVDNTDAYAASITAWLDSLDDVSNANARAYLRFQHATDPSIYAEFAVTGAVVDGTGYRKIPVSPIIGVVPSNGVTLTVQASKSGADGVTAGLRYNFSTTTTDSDPGAGTLRLNHATPASATAGYIDNADADGATVTSWLDSWDDSSATIRGTVLIRSITTPSTYALYQVTGSIVDGTGYRKVTLTYVSGTGTFSNGTTVAIQFTRSGDSGAGSDTDRRNVLMMMANSAKALAGYQRFLDTFADGYKASDGIAAGSSSNYTADTSTGRVLPTQSGTTTSMGTASTTTAYGAVTLIDRSQTIANGDIVSEVGIYLNSAATVTAKIVKRNSAGNYDIVVSESFSHPGGGFANKTLSSQYTVPGSGTYHVGFYLNATEANRTGAVNRAYKASTDVTGTGQTGFTEDSNAGIPPMRYVSNPTPNNMTVVTTAQTLDAARTKMRVTLEIDPIVAVTLGTDLTIEASCNGGTNYTAASTYTDCGKGQSGRTIIETDEMTCTSGASAQVRVKSLNNKNVAVHKLTWKAAA